MRVIRNIMIAGMMWGMLPAVAQKIDDARMERDLEVAKNVLRTLIQQQFDKQRMFFGLEIAATYQQGFGVTFRLPADFTTPVAFAFGETEPVIWMDGPTSGAYSYSVVSPRRSRDEQLAREELEKELDNAVTLRGRAVERKQVDLDSLRNAYNGKIIQASKEFMLDYGDMISQLAANERIVITNQGEQPRVWVGQFFKSPKRTHLSLEIAKADIASYKLGKTTRDQALDKIKVVNTETVEAVEPDLELLSSIFNRLYRSDLATTYFTDEGIYYERLKDFGVVYYMRLYSSNQSRGGLYHMPTARLSDVDQATRDKKVKEMYPGFEKELKENMIEYGRTLKSLSDNESLVFNVKLTKCEGCGIPATLEASVKGSVLKEYSAGKITRDAAIGKVILKKGQNQ